MKVPNSRLSQSSMKKNITDLPFVVAHTSRKIPIVSRIHLQKILQHHINIIYEPRLHVYITYLLVKHPFYFMSALYTYIDYWSVSRQNHQKPKVAVQQYNPFQEESFTHLPGILRRMPVELSSVALACPKLAFYWWSV